MNEIKKVKTEPRIRVPMIELPKGGVVTPGLRQGPGSDDVVNFALEIPTSAVKEMAALLREIADEIEANAT